MKDLLKGIGFLMALLAWGMVVSMVVIVANPNPAKAINTSQDGFWHTITLVRGGKEYQVDVWCRVPLPAKEAPQKTILWTPSPLAP